jgi:hypothetical protein
MTAAAAPKEGDGGKMGKEDERGKTGVKEGGKEALIALVWGQEKKRFLFQALLREQEVCAAVHSFIVVTLLVFHNAMGP